MRGGQGGTETMTKRLGLAALLALLASLVLPGMAFGQEEAVDPAALDLELDNLWIMVACALVFLMQAGFLLLEIGFSRQKNVGTGVAKILLNLAMITIAWWAIGYGINSAPAASSSTSVR
jgi:Amt family ammonium transporter